MSGWLTIPTRIEGSRSKFIEDTERLVLDKCVQLDAAAKSVLADVSALTNSPALAEFRVLPVLLVGGGYPISPFTMAYIDEQLQARALLTGPRIDPLCIIDLGELEMLEGLGERGKDVVELLRGWRSSGIREIPLRNYLLQYHGGGADVRPSRMDGPVAETFDRIHAVLKIIEP